MTTQTTQGVHHIGLTVAKLDASKEFFTDLLGWEQVGSNPEYPAVFVSDGSIMLTLWQAKNPNNANAFDKNNNIGLHHLAIQVGDRETLDKIYEKLVAEDNVEIEFSPESLREGPTVHMMCYEPSGIRVEFIVPA